MLVEEEEFRASSFSATVYAVVFLESLQLQATIQRPGYSGTVLIFSSGEDVIIHPCSLVEKKICPFTSTAPHLAT